MWLLLLLEVAVVLIIVISIVIVVRIVQISSQCELLVAVRLPSCSAFGNQGDRTCKLLKLGISSNYYYCYYCYYYCYYCRCINISATTMIISNVVTIKATIVAILATIIFTSIAASIAAVVTIIIVSVRMRCYWYYYDYCCYSDIYCCS